MVGDKEVGGGDLPTIADDLVVTKYKMAAEIVNSELVIMVIMVIMFIMFITVIIVIIVIIVILVVKYKMAAVIVNRENFKYQLTNVTTVPLKNICHAVIS